MHHENVSKLHTALKVPDLSGTKLIYVKYLYQVRNALYPLQMIPALRPWKTNRGAPFYTGFSFYFPHISSRSRLLKELILYKGYSSHFVH